MHFKLKLVLCAFFLIWFILFAYVVFVLEWQGMKNFMFEKLSPPPVLASKKTHAIHLVLAASKEQSGGMFATINSIVKNTKYFIHFNLITTESEIGHFRDWIKNSTLAGISYTLIPFSERWLEQKGHFKLQGAHNIISYSRLYLPELLPDLKDRIIFVDNDIIVQGDIIELYNVLIRSDHYGAFSEDCHSASKHLGRNQHYYLDFLNFNNDHIEKLKMKPSACSFNTGVFVLLLDKWRSNHLSKKADYWLEIYAREKILSPKYFGDAVAPVMMILLYKKISFIDPMWHIRHLGITPGSRYSRAFLLKAKLLHWDGQFKPWSRKSAHVDLWQKYFVPDPTGQFQIVRRW